MEKESNKILIAVLILLVVVLGGMVLYSFALKPAISGYVVNAQNQGVNLAVASIVNQIQQQGYVQIPVGNQTLVLVPYNPTQQQQTINVDEAE
ncbi:hypothetical protein HY449_03510 [Candidatus Pacearchaeota archaeon]|nr:hypothetical protein [Candidatus Pacearchaeota archaeon]